MPSSLICALALTAFAQVGSTSNIAKFINQGLGVNETTSTLASTSASASSNATNTSSSSSLITSAPVLSSTNATSASVINGTAAFTTFLNITLSECISSGLPQASACSSSWTSWSSASASFLSAHMSTFTTTTVLPPAAQVLGPIAILGEPWANASTPYATCNGIPRYSGGWTSTGTSPIPSGTSQTVEIPGTQTLSTYPVPEPTCCIGSSDCLTLQDEWHIVNPLIYPFNSSAGSGWYDGPPASYPHCNTTEMVMFGPGGAGDCSGCWLIGENAKVFYWPEPVEPAPACPDSYTFGAATTLSSNLTGPVTAVVTLTNENFPNVTSFATLTSPTVYMSVLDIEGRDGCHDFYGAPIAGTIFPLGTDELKSAVMTFSGMTDEAASSSMASIIAHQQTEKYTDLFGLGWQTDFSVNVFNYPIVTQTVDMNLADFNRPPPYLSYYLGQAGVYCLNNGGGGVFAPGLPCDSIFDVSYTPAVKLGTLVRSMNPLWSTCQLDFGFDPPIALTAANSVAPPSVFGVSSTSPRTTSVTALPESISTTPAVPCSTPKPNTPTPTSRPTTRAESTAAEASSSSSSQDLIGVIASLLGSSSTSHTQHATSTVDPADPGTSTNSIAVVTVGSSVVTARISQPVVIGSTTISAGGAAATISGQTISAGSAGIVVGSTTAVFSADPANSHASASSATFVAGTSSYAAVQSGSVVVVSGSNGPIATLTAGGAATTLQGQIVSAGSSGLRVGTSTVALTAAPDSNGPAATAITINGQTLSFSQVAGSTGLAVADGVTLTNGGSATVVDGQTLSLGSNGVVINGHTTAALPGVATTGNAQLTTVVLDGQTVTAAEFPGGSSAVVDGSITLHADGPPITVHGQILSLGGNGLVMVATDGAATTLAFDSIDVAAVTTMTAGGQLLTISSLANGNDVVDGSVTLTPGGPATTLPDGEVLSEDPSGHLIVGSSTLPLSAATTAPSGSSGGTTAARPSAAKTGAAVRSGRVAVGGLALAFVAGAMVMLM